MSKALNVLKLFFSLVSINSTAQVARDRPPRVLMPLDRTVVYTGTAFSIPIPSDTFVDEDGDTYNLRLKMTKENGEKLPRWIGLNQEKRLVYGFPLKGNAPYTFTFSLFAYDRLNASSKRDLSIQVEEQQFPHNHEIIVTTENLRYQAYMTNLDLRYNLAKSLIGHVTQLSTVEAPLWVKHYDRDDREMTLTIVLKNLPNASCNKEAINDMATKLETLGRLSIGTGPPSGGKSKLEIRLKKVKVNFLGTCNRAPDAEKAPLIAGWLKHVLPILILLAVVGIPVTISIFVRRSKARAARERRRKANGLGRKREEDACFNYTVHYNNRYPSMLSVSNNSREEGMTDDEVTSRRVAIGNVKPKNAQNAGASNLSQNVLKKPDNSKKPIKSMREMMYEDDDDDDGEKVELNIPVYYNIRKGADVDEEASIMDVNLSELAGNLSSKLMTIGKSVLSATGERMDGNVVNEDPGLREDNTVNPVVNQAKAESLMSNSPSIPSKLVDFTKSVLNISQTQTRGPDEPTSGPSTLTKLKDFGKSVLSLSGGTDPTPKEDFCEGWEPYGYFDHETSHTNVWDAGGWNGQQDGMQYGTYDAEASQFDVPSHEDQSCYNVYDVTADVLEYSDSSWYTGETAETSVSSYRRETEAPVASYAQYDSQGYADLADAYRQKDEEVSRFMRNFAEVEPRASPQGTWEHVDHHSDGGFYHDYVNPYHHGDVYKGSLSSRSTRSKNPRTMEMHSRGDQDLFTSMPDLAEFPPSRPRRKSFQVGDRGGSFLGSLFSLSEQDKQPSGSITGYIKTQVEGIMGRSEGNLSSRIFQKSDDPFS